MMRAPPSEGSLLAAGCRDAGIALPFPPCRTGGQSGAGWPVAPDGAFDMRKAVAHGGSLRQAAESAKGPVTMLAGFGLPQDEDAGMLAHSGIFGLSGSGLHPAVLSSLFGDGCFLAHPRPPGNTSSSDFKGLEKPNCVSILRAPGHRSGGPRSPDHDGLSSLRLQPRAKKYAARQGGFIYFGHVSQKTLPGGHQRTPNLPRETGAIRQFWRWSGSVRLNAPPTSDPGGSAYEPGGGRGDMRDHVQHHGANLSERADGRQAMKNGPQQAGWRCVVNMSHMKIYFSGP